MSKELKVHHQEDLLAEIKNLRLEVREINKVGKIQKYPDNLKRAVFNGIKSGLSPRFIALEVGIPVSTIYSWAGYPKDHMLHNMRCVKIVQNLPQREEAALKIMSKFTIILKSGVILELPDTGLLDQALLQTLSNLGA